MPASKNHPVWDVYDALRTARLNIKYFSAKLSRLKTINFWIEFILALTASAAVVAFKFWKTPLGSQTWEYLAIVSAVLAVLKPLLNLTQKIQAMEETVTGFKSLDYDLKLIQIQVRQRKAYDKELSDKFLASMERTRDLVTKNNNGDEDKRLKKRCTATVLQELPVDNFFVPA